MKNIIVDTDMGVDDIIAIGLLLNSPAANVRAINTVQGVANLNTGTQNLARLLTWLGKFTIPIYKGFKPPKQKINFPKIDRQRANNLTLLKNIPLPSKPSKKIIIKKLKSNLSSPTSLLCLGPLTNIAKIITNSKINIKEMFIMGGAVFNPGNVPPDYTNEYNIALDPAAAKTVFSSGLPITLIATDTTKQVPAKDKIFLRQVLATKPQTVIGKIIKLIIINNRRDFIDFYDPLATTILVNPKFISESKKINLTITPDGQTIGQPNNAGNINLVTKIDKRNCYKFIVESIN